MEIYGGTNGTLILTIDASLSTPIPYRGLCA
jgi:hypothetical protein